MIKFSTIKFEEQEDRIILRFMKIYETFILKKDLKSVGKWTLGENWIEVENEKKFWRYFNNAFDKLINKMTGKKTIYVHQNSGIPLYGTLFFGIIDRGTNIIEIKPNTGCNLDCQFCSVDEGTSSKKEYDFVVEKDYLVNGVREIIDYKQETEPVTIDVFINPHGEPLLYSEIVGLVKDLRSIENVGIISIITNATILTKELADKLVDAGLNQINISINSVENNRACELAGSKSYNSKTVLEIIEYLSHKIKVIIAPVWMHKVNDEDIEKLIQFAKEKEIQIGIQNYMVHKRGKKVTKQVPWDKFYEQLDEWGSRYEIDLRTIDHTLFKTKKLERPIQKGNLIEVEIVCPGRTKSERIGVSNGRCVTIVECNKNSGRMKVRILKDKDGVFVGES